MQDIIGIVSRILYHTDVGPTIKKYCSVIIIYLEIAEIKKENSPF